MDNNLSESLENAVYLSNLRDILKDTFEIKIDIFLKEWILKELPIVGSLSISRLFSDKYFSITN